MNNLKKTLQLLIIAGAYMASLSAIAHYNELKELSPEVRAKEFSLSKKALALNGYDPVAYFEEGPAKGSKKLSHTFKGVTYRFSSEENLEAFKQDPLAYEPQYGGWCAWAMYDGGGRTAPNPKRFKIIDNKLYVFYDGTFGNTLELWNKKANDAALIGKANYFWEDQVLGEH